MIGMPARLQPLTAHGAAALRSEEQGDPSGGTEAARAHRPESAIRAAQRETSD
jgi:hypothetical protein